MMLLKIKKPCPTSVWNKVPDSESKALRGAGTLSTDLSSMDCDERKG